MSITLLNWDEDIPVLVSEALRYMGVKGDAPDISAIAEELLPELQHAASLKACFGEFPVEMGDSVSVSVGCITTESESLRHCLDGCTSAVIFAATTGVGVDRLIARYSKLSPSKAVVLSALGSAMIEEWCDRVCRSIAEEQAAKGKLTRPRFSPGYGGFELSSQHTIARLLETEKNIGLYFTDSLMMIPEKSVTAIVGIYDR